jgi:hypothetical protein
MKRQMYDGMVIAVALAVGPMGRRARAASYTWTNSAEGAFGCWTNGINWGQDEAVYPTNGDTAYLTDTIAGGACTNLFDCTPGLGGPMASLVISNSGAGQAWLIVTNAELDVDAFALGHQRRLCLRRQPDCHYRRAAGCGARGALSRMS